ncbi:MAG: hypothetical protein IIB54_16100 [Planctomycetes bacterium]|nr:hypothetical protein [Planctomycetota bacterium]
MTQQIGYEVVDRQTVLMVLGVFCVGLLVSFVWLRRVRRMELMLWMSPAIALCVAVILTTMGFRSRRSVPEMVAVAQIVEVAQNSEEANITGLMAVYRQDASQSTIGVRRGGLLQVDLRNSPRRHGECSGLTWIVGNGPI